MNGNVDNGLAVYKKACAACHRYGEFGHLVGPDLKSVVDHSAEKLLTNILDPNLDIQPGYRAYGCLLQSGELLFGLIESENATGVVFKLTDGRKRTVLRKEIETLKSTGVSLMPENLESTLTRQELADVIAFVQSEPGQTVNSSRDPLTEEQSDRELLLNICRELLLSHETFLLTRQLGTQRLSFCFFHLKGSATELRLGCARADRSAERWLELLRIRFDQLVLPEPVIAIRLRSGMTQALQARSTRLNFHAANDKPVRRYSIAQLAERLIARIGDHSVHSVTLVAEHRPQYAWRAQSLLADWASSTLSEVRRCLRRPLWMLPEPALLSADSGYPLHQGRRLRLLHGPERLETGWWDEDGISRDYYTAVNPRGIRLWIFRNRNRTASWYLHGYFG